MYLHNDKELFGDIVALTAEKMGQAQDIIEKDYYVTIILKELSSCDYYNGVYKRYFLMAL